ncbi:hypothetical protein BC835DRAFT_970103 [Cytidiella melzeri]|nr:hypothetical protein BC835DRAFT_970103 [Cytidiella melzeri]
MRPSLPRLVRIIRDRAAEGTLAAPLPEPIRSDVRPPTLIQALLKRKEDQGSSYPPNIRIESALPKHALKNVPADIRKELLSVTKER